MDYTAMEQPFGTVSEMPPVDGGGVCEVLREAIEVLHDREKDFRQAAECVTSPILKNELLNYSGQRALFVGELQGFERTYGRNDVDDSGTVAGAFHRAWVGLKSAVSKRSNRSILEGLAAAEKAAADFYVEVLATRGLPSQVSQCLSRQCAELQKGQFELSNRCAACGD